MMDYKWYTVASAWIHDLFGRCHDCHWRYATWLYAPGIKNCCDKCVPRGCSCTMEPKDGDYENESPDNWEKQRDEQGREVPCCEWWQKDKPFKLVWTKKNSLGKSSQ